MKLFCTNKLLILILAAIFIGVLCSCTKDVSQDPQYNYGFKYNHVYKTIDETILEKESDFKTLYFLDKINEAGKKDMDDYLSLESRMVALPKGTLFRVERLTRVINPENNTLLVEVKILNGHFKNIQATCFLYVDKYTDSIECDKSYKELRLIAKIPDPAVVIDLGEMPEYKDEKSIPEPEPITYTP